MLSGTSPTDDSWVKIENGQVVDYSLKFDDYVVSYDEQNNKNICNQRKPKRQSRAVFYE